MDELRELRAAIEDVYVDALLDALARRARARDARRSTRSTLGASVRASLALERVARAWALLHGRDFVEPADVERLFIPVLGHRLVLDAVVPRRGARTLDGDELLERVARRCLERRAAAARPTGVDRREAQRRRRPFPLVPRRRVAGLAVRRQRSLAPRARQRASPARGPTGPATALASIDWRASARLSAARGDDEFVVREHFADEAPRGRRRHRPGAVERRRGLGLREAGGAARDRRGRGGQRRSRARRLRLPRRLRALGALASAAAGDARAGARALRRAGRRRVRALGRPRRNRVEAPPGTFVFVLSDFLAPPTDDAWRRALARAGTSSPSWRRTRSGSASFPAVGGLLLPVLDGRVRGVRLSRREAAARRDANERRFAELLRGFAALKLDPVVLDGSDLRSVDAALHAWARRRR